MPAASMWVCVCLCACVWASCIYSILFTTQTQRHMSKHAGLHTNCMHTVYILYNGRLNWQNINIYIFTLSILNILFQEFSGERKCWEHEQECNHLVLLPAFVTMLVKLIEPLCCDFIAQFLIKTFALNKVWCRCGFRLKVMLAQAILQVKVVNFNTLPPKLVHSVTIDQGAHREIISRSQQEHGLKIHVH